MERRLPFEFNARHSSLPAYLDFSFVVPFIYFLILHSSSLLVFQYPSTPMCLYLYFWWVCCSLHEGAGGLCTKNEINASSSLSLTMFCVLFIAVQALT